MNNNDEIPLDNELVEKFEEWWEDNSNTFFNKKTTKEVALEAWLKSASNTRLDDWEYHRKKI